MSLSLVLLAAGVGRRYGGAKQFDGVGPGGATLMDYTLFDAVRAGFTRVVFVLRPEDERAWREAAVVRYGNRIEVACVAQRIDDLPSGRTPPTGRTRPWGTGHAVLVATAELSGPFAVANADDYYGPASLERIAGFLKETDTGDVPTHALIGFALRDTLPLKGPVSRAICSCSANDELIGLREVAGIERNEDGGRFTDDAGRAHQLDGDTIVSMNLWGFRQSITGHLRSAFQAFVEAHGHSLDRELFLPGVIGGLLEAGLARVRVLRTPDRWCGLTHADDRPAVMRFLAERVAAGKYPARLWS